jgi:hypothetical protein
VVVQLHLKGKRGDIAMKRSMLALAVGIVALA